MAFLKFIASTIGNDEIEFGSIKAYELSRDSDAACDGLRLTIGNSNIMDELVGIKAYMGSELIFNGLVDVQRDSFNNGGRECFIYARSSASVLLDNEAEPRSYQAPTALALFRCNAEKFGFENKLPMLSIETNYLVNKGTSCFGAINNFVRGLTGKSIVISPKNEIMLAQSDGIIDVSSLNIISEKRAINRGNLISIIDYKIDGDNNYSRHTKSNFLEKRGINASKKINLSTLPIWQREYTARANLMDLTSSYYEVELTAYECVSPMLFDRAVGSSSLENMDGYYVSSVCIILDSNGERTKIKFKKEYDLEDITYVAE